jgi:hypothetical protein
MVHPRVPREGRLGVWGYPGSLTCAAERSERKRHSQRARLPYYCRTDKLLGYLLSSKLLIIMASPTGFEPVLSPRKGLLQRAPTSSSLLALWP